MSTDVSTCKLYQGEEEDEQCGPPDVGHLDSVVGAAICSGVAVAPIEYRVYRPEAGGYIRPSVFCIFLHFAFLHFNTLVIN